LAVPAAFEFLKPLSVEGADFLDPGGSSLSEFRVVLGSPCSRGLPQDFALTQ